MYVDPLQYTRYIRDFSPQISGEYEAQFITTRDEERLVFHLQIACKRKFSPEWVGAYPQLEVSFEQHHAGQKHSQPHIQVRIHSIEKIAHLGSYYFLFDCSSEDELLTLIYGYLVLSSQILESIHESLPQKIFNLALMEAENLPRYLQDLREKIQKIPDIHFNPSNPSIRRRLGKSLRPDAEGYVHLSPNDFAQLLSNTTEAGQLKPFIDLLEQD